ncbi:MAG: hypothetical protein JRC60_02605 [Deltaproteobacteria bacterium]|nr:hypothetical protein [Deltaproteobacteria bacterium]
MEEMIRAVPLFADSGEDFSSLHTRRIASDGSYTLTFGKPGKYELRLWGNPVSEFEIKDEESGLSVSGLSETIRLPYNYFIQIRPLTRRIETVDSKTGKKRTKRVPVEFSDIPEIQVINPLSGEIAKTFSADKSLIVPIPDQYAPPNAFVFNVVAKGCIPALITLRAIPADKRNNINYRIIKIAPRLPGKIGVHNVVTKTYFWIEMVTFNSKGQKKPWLLSYSEKTLRGTAAPILIKGLDYTRHAPRPFLDEQGNVMLVQYSESSDGKTIKKTFQFQGSKRWTEVSYPYPLFKFKGRLINNTNWIVPNYRGIPLPMGEIGIRTQGLVEVCSHDIRERLSQCSKEEVAGEHSFTVHFDQETGEIEFDPPEGQCTGILQGVDEDNRWCADPDFSSLDNRLKSENESIQKRFEAMAKAGEIPDDAIVRVGRGNLIEGQAWINGEGPITYVHKRTIFLGFNSDGTPDIMRNDDGTPVFAKYSDLESAGNAINLIGNSDDGYTSPKLLNMKEGPYPELRYEAKKNNEKTVVKVYPWNYSWHIDDGEIIVDRSGIFKPGDPNQDSDDDGVSDLKDLCPSTPAKTAVNEDGCPTSDYLGVLSPDTDRDVEIKTGSTQDITIAVEYALDTVDSGVIRVTAETVKRTVFSKDYPVTRGGNNMDIIFPVALYADEPIMSVTLKLIPKGYSIGPEEVVRYLGIIGAFTVDIDYDGAIVAHPKNRKELTLTITDSEDKPVQGREFTVISQALTAPYLEGGWLNAKGRSSVEVKTDQEGKTSVEYIPPAVLREKIGRMMDPAIFFPATHQIEVRDRANTEQKTTVEIPLDSPYPKISKFAVPGGDLAGTWQKNPSIVVIDDADSKTFTISLWGKGEFGYSGGHGYDEELEVDGATSPFEFRFKAEKMGLDLNDLPDVLKEFRKTNTKLFIRYASLLGGKKLLKAFWVKGSKMQKFIKTADGAEIPYTVENAAKFKDKGFFLVNKMVSPGGDWAAKTVDVGDYALGAHKNIREGADTYTNQIANQKIAVREETGTESTDVVLDGVHATIGFLDTYQSFADLANGVPMDPYSEALKILYQNAKTFYSLHRKFEDAAESWEDVLFMPIMVKVEDEEEGHSIHRMAKYAVKFSKKAGEN